MTKIYYTKLDGLRALAVIAVMISHWVYIDFIKKLGLGFLGVNLFFVLSGFLITEILLKQIYKKENEIEILKKFYIKRTLRIFPIYYLVIIFAFLLNLDNSRSLWGYTFTYTLNFYNAFTGNVGTALSHIWSLCVEEQFYLIWPLLLLLFKPAYHKRLILSAILFALFFRISLYAFKVPNYNIHNYRMMPGCMDTLGFGALLAYLKLNHEIWLKQILKKIYIPVFALIGYILIVYFIKPGSFIFEAFLRFLVAICSFYLIGRGLYEMNNNFGQFLENKWIQFLGKISYGLYLYHFIISSLLNEWFINYWNAIKPSIPGILKYNSYLVSFPLYLSISIFIASLSYFFIEEPFFRLKGKYEKKWNQKSVSLLSDAVV